MSLFSSIQMAGNSLQANQIGLQVVGQNIANANTPGYLREQANLVPAGSARQGNLILGLGVRVDSIKQTIDNFLEQRLRTANSDVTSSSAQQDTLQQLEGLIGELSDTDLSTSMNNFFSSIQDVLNQPDSVAVRNLAVLQGQTLTQDVNRLASRVSNLRSDLDKQVVSDANDINRLIETVRQLNIRIAQTENSDTSNSDAVGLRDQRNSALSDLSKLVDINVVEQPSGAVSVFSGGDFLVFEGESHPVKVVQQTDRGITVSNIKLISSDAPIQSTSGAVAGLVNARDQVLGGFLDNLDSFSSTLISEFNKLYSQGQGLKGFTTTTSEHAVDDPSGALDSVGLPFTPVNGSFQLQVLNKKTGLTQTSDITVDLNGLDGDTSLNDLAAQLNAVDGVSASIAHGQLTITSDSPDLEFSFANDSSGILSSLGINTFFTGTTALSMGVNKELASDPAKFAASRGGIGEDTAGAVDLSAFLDRPLDSADGSSIGLLYNRLTSQVTQSSAVAKSVADGFSTYQQTLIGQHMSVSGVSIDEETINMIQLQRAFQANAKYISTLSDLLGVLVQL